MDISNRGVWAKDAFRSAGTPVCIIEMAGRRKTNLYLNRRTSKKARRIG